MKVAQWSDWLIDWGERLGFRLAVLYVASKVGRGNSGHGIVRGNSGHFNVATGKKHPFYSCF